MTITRRRTALIAFLSLLFVAGLVNLKRSAPSNELASKRATIIQDDVPSMVPVPQIENAAVPVFSQKSENSSSLDTFDAWVAEYLAAPEAVRAAREAEGVKLAEARKKELAALIESNPEQALKRSTSVVRQRALPKVVREHLEEHVSAEGQLGTVISTPLNANDPIEKKRVVNVGEKIYRAYTYGRRNDPQLDNKTIPIHGIAIGGKMAVSETPVKVVEAGEIEPAVLQAAREKSSCPISSIASKDNDKAVAVLVGSRVVYVCHDGHIAELSEDLLNQEAAEPPIAQSAWTEGPKTCLYIPVYFKDQTAGPSLTDMTAVSNYMVANSYSKTSMTTTFTPAFQLSKNAADYPDEYGLYTEARNLAKAAGWDYVNYNLDCVRYSGGPGSFGGQAYVGARGCWLKTNSSGTGAHEFGHNYGLWHANYWSTTDGTTIGAGSNQEYGNIFDVMGGSGSFPKGHFNAYEKNLLNWIPNANTTSVTASGTYRIYAHDLSTLNTNNRYGIKINKDTDRVYWVEYRQNSGWSTNPWIMNGVTLLWDRWASSNSGSQLLDTTPGSADGKNDAPIVIGRTFSDTAAGIHFTLTNRGGTSPDLWADVVVNVGTFPGNVAPTLSIAASKTNPATNEVVTFTATATDANGDPLAYHWNFGDNTFGPNASTATKSWSTTGTKTVTCIVSDMKGGTATQTITINVSNTTTPSVTVSATDNSATETAGNNGTFTFTLSSAAATATTINFTVGGTATTTSDYASIGTTVSIAAGATTATKTVTPVDDTSVEGNETVTVTLGTGTGYNVGSPSSATVTITDNDTAPATKLAFSVHPSNTTAGATISPAVKVAIQDASGNTVTTATNAVTLAIGTNPSSGTLGGTLTVNAVAGVATFSNLSINNAGNGYTLTAAASGLTGATSNTFNVGPAVGNGDGLAGIYYDNMDFTGTAVSRIDSTIDFNWGSGVPHASIAADTFSVRWTGKVLPQYSETYTFYTTTDDGVRLWVNNVLLVDKWVNQGPTEWSGTIALTAGTQYDIRMEYYENTGGAEAHLSWSSPSLPKAVIPKSQLFSGGLPPTVSFSTASSNGGEGTTSVNLNVALSAASTQTITVAYAVSGGTATGSGTDYTLASGTLTFTPSQTTKTIPITIVNDTLDEANETIQVALQNPQYATLGTNAAHTYTINDDDSAPTVAFNAASSNGSEATTSVNLAVSLSTASGQAVSVSYSVTGGTATGSGTDYTLANGTVNFAAGETTKNIVLSVVNDSIDEVNETVAVTLAQPTNATLGTNTVHTYTINDDDNPPTVAFSAASSSGNESVTPANLTVTLSSVSSLQVSVNYAVTGGTATGGGVDYTLASGTLTFAAGTTSKTIPITIVNNTVKEPNETIQVTLSQPTNATLGTTTVHTYTINNDDNTAPVANNNSLSTTKNVAVGGNLAATDADGDALTYDVVANGSMGTAVITDAATGAFTYTPNANVKGTDTFTFRANDGSANSNVATITVQIKNSKPVASSSSTTTTSTTTASGSLTASDPDNDSLTYTVVTGGTLGTLTLDPATGTYTYVPSGATGQDVITFTVTDGDVQSDTATLTVNINPPLSILSGPTASQPQIVGTPITFSVAASDAATTFTWDFGNGQSGSGATATQTYGAAGTYIVTVTATNGAETISAPLTIFVAPIDDGSGGGGGGASTIIDSDGDGVSDSNELIMGTNPLDAGSMMKVPMTITKVGVSAKFNIAGKDSATVSGILPAFPALFNPAGLPVTLDVGGATGTFTLDAKGKAKTKTGSFQISLKPSKRNKTTKKVEFLGGPLPFKAKITGSFASTWLDEGFDPAVSQKNVSHSVTVDLKFFGNVYTGDASGLYTAVAGRGGRFKK